MFDNVVALNAERHGAWRFSPVSSWAHARAEQAVPVLAGEAAEAAKEHVIVFPRGEAVLPVLLLGVESKKNAYVGEDGQWAAAYVPQHVRRYPFALSERPASEVASEAQRRFTLCIAADAPHFSAEQGEALFTDDGKPAAWLSERQRELVQLHTQGERTQFQVQQIVDAGLLIERAVPVVAAGGRALGIEGLRVLDVDRYQALDESQRQPLRESGALALIEAHLASLKNLARGPLAAAARELRDARRAPAGFMSAEVLLKVAPLLKKHRDTSQIKPSAHGLFAGTSVADKR